MKSLSLVLPCYNEAESLPPLIERYRKLAVARGISAGQFELILVDNGSSDGTAEILKEAMANPELSFLKVVTVSPNVGYGNGIYQGLLAAKYQFVGFSHADEQCHPEDVFKAWDLCGDSSNQLVKGKRVGRNWQARAFSFGFKQCARLILAVDLNEINAQPKVFPCELVTKLKVNPPLNFAFDLFVLLIAMQNGISIQEMEVEFPARAHGESKWAATFRSKAKHIGLLIQFMLEYRKR